jgi:hypothetical protein
MNASRTIGRACLLLALGASSALAQKKGEKASDEVEFTSSCACTSCDGKNRWDVKTDKTPAPASVAADHRLTPSELRKWKGPGGKIGKSTPRSGKETEFFALTGEIRYARLEDDGDIHLQLADQGKGPDAENDGDDTSVNDRDGAAPSRTTVWEIHPVMRLMVGGT